MPARSRHAQEALCRRELFVKVKNLFACFLYRALDALDAHVHPVGILIDQQLQSYRRSDVRRIRGIAGDLAHSRNENEFLRNPLLLLGELRGNRPRVEKGGRGRTLTVDENFPGIKSVFRQLLRIHRAVFRRNDSRCKAVQKFVFAVPNRIVSPLQRNHSVDDARSVEGSRERKRGLPDKRQNPLPSVAVFIGKIPLEKKSIPRNYFKPSFGIRPVRTGIPLDQNFHVFPIGAAVAVQRTFPPARRGIGHKREFFDLFALELLLDLGDGHCFGMNETSDLTHILRRQRIGIHFEGRESDHVHVSLFHGVSPLVCADDVAVVEIPYHLVKRGSQDLRPMGGAGYDRVEIDSVSD